MTLIFFFYLLKVTKEELNNQCFANDDYGHSYLPGSDVLAGNYLDVSSEEPDETVYYVDNKKAIVLSHSVVGICPQ